MSIAKLHMEERWFEHNYTHWLFFVPYNHLQINHVSLLFQKLKQHEYNWACYDGTFDTAQKWSDGMEWSLHKVSQLKHSFEWVLDTHLVFVSWVHTHAQLGLGQVIEEAK